MAKKEQAATGPEVSSLPIKQDDSPLVIDLPDGQKLVVGHLSNGSVIEVATWRGTGRPDSRTSRLMLGMSSAAGAAEQAAAEEAQKASVAKKSPIAPLHEAINKVLASFKSTKISAPKKSKKTEAPTESGEEPTPFIQTVSAPAPTPRADVDSDVDEWLNNLIKKSEAKSAKTPAKSAAKAPTKAPAKKAAPKPTVRKAAAKKTTGRSR